MEIGGQDGEAIPRIGLGTYRLRGDECVDAVLAAIEIGYRLIDTAAAYENEREIGEAIRLSGLPRESFFLVTKVRPTDLEEAAFDRSVQRSLRDLGVDAVDLLLIHWPNRSMTAAEMVRPLNAAKRRGQARHIGVSNFNVELMEAAWAATEEPLFANQCEYHPYLSQAKVIGACRRHEMTFMAYSPLGKRAALDEPLIHDIATRLGRTPAQIILRWHIQQEGVLPIPKSASSVHIRQNFDVFGFDIPAAEMRAINELADPGGRLVESHFSPKWD